MPTNVKPTFLDQLRSSGLLEPEQLKELAQLPEAKQADPRPLARQVFQRGWLTKHQINQVVAGRAKELLVGPYILGYVRTATNSFNIGLALLAVSMVIGAGCVLSVRHARH